MPSLDRDCHQDLNDIFEAVDSGNAIVLVALGLSAAFDTIDHSVLINRLEYTLGLGVLPLNGSSLISAVELALLKSVERGLRQQAL